MVEEKDTSLRKIEALFKDSWVVFKTGWKKFLLLSFILAVAAILIYIGYFMIFYFYGLKPNLGFRITTEEEAGLAVETLLLIFLGIGLLLLLLVGTLFSLVTNKMVYSVAEGKSVGWKQALIYGVKNYLSYLWISLALALAIVLGYIALIVPGIILTVFWSMLSPVFIIEGKRGFAVAKRSWRLVKGHFWDVFLRLILIVVLGLVLSMLQSPFDQSVAGSVFSLVVFVPLQFIFTFFSIAYSYHIYRDLVAIEEQ